MQQPRRQISIEAEKKRNVAIAIALAATGIALGIFLYIGMFVVMFAYPFAFFSIMPIPSDNKDLVSINGRLLLFTEKVDFRGASFKQEPKTRILMSEFNGEKFANPVEVDPFSTVSAYDGKLYFFDEGLYRAYDFKGWQVYENAAIGSSPKGVASPEGIWVLSNLMGRPALVLLKDDLALDVPLPLTEEDEANLRLCSSQLMWSGGQLHLFWKIGGSLLHEKFDGEHWEAAGYFEDPGNYDVTEYQGNLTLFTHVRAHEFKRWTYEAEGWTSQYLGVSDKGNMSIDFQAADYGGKVALLVNNAFFPQKLYLLDDGKVSKQFSLGGMFDNLLVSWSVLFSSAFYLPIGLLIFIISAIVNKYKLTFWPLRKGRVRFASIFRRFLAYTLDTIISTLPLTVAILIVFKRGLPFDDPFMFVGIIFALVGGTILLKYLYFSLFEGFWGWTPGKWVCGIRVLRDNFSKCTVGRAFLRNLLRIADGMFYYLVGLVTIGATLKWQRLGDMAAGTVVVRYRRRKKAKA